TMREKLFEPLGMSQTEFEPTPKMEENLAIPYATSQGGKVVPTVRLRLDVYPAGDVYSTPSDIARFLLMFLNGGKSGGKQVLSPAAIQEMGRRQFEGPFGLGWVVDSHNNRRVLWHNGGVRGFSSQMRIDPEKRLGIVLFANNFNIFDLANDPLPP